MRLFQIVAPTVFAVLSIGLGSQVWAGVMSGEDLVAICEPARADPVYRLKLSECAGYIIGVSDTFDCKNKTLGYNWDSTKFQDQQKLVNAVLAWMHLHPHVLHYQASGLVASALSSEHPCPESIARQ